MENQIINLRLVLEGCLNGNEQSQRKLYGYYYGYGMKVAFRYAANRMEAEEIFNDAFLRIFKNMDKYNPSYPFRNWLHKIIVHAAIDYFRKFKKHRAVYSTEAISESLHNIYFIPSVEPTDDALPILQQLSPVYRMVFNLYVMEDYKHREIAEMLAISVGASKSNLARAKIRLREIWLKRKGAPNQLNEHG